MEIPVIESGDDCIGIEYRCQWLNPLSIAADGDIIIGVGGIKVLPVAKALIQRIPDPFIGAIRIEENIIRSV